MYRFKNAPNKLDSMGQNENFVKFEQRNMFV